MPDKNPVNPPSIRQHKQDLLWQIFVPFFFMVVLIIAGAVLVFTGEAHHTRLWADISIIWLFIPAILMALLTLVVLAGLIYILAKLQNILPKYTSRVQATADLISKTIGRIVDGITKPVLWGHQAGAAFRSLFRIRK